MRHRAAPPLPRDEAAAHDVRYVPLVDDDRKLGAVLILEDTTRAVALAEERLREDAPQPIRGAASQKQGR